MSRPRPGASMSAVITIIETASMIVWFRASAIAGRATGSCTFVRSWRSVAPSERPASTVFAGTPRMPNAVMRIAAGIA